MPTEKEIMMARRWLCINSKYQGELIEKDPLMAEHHRGERDMFDLTGRIIEALTSKGSTHLGDTNK